MKDKFKVGKSYQVKITFHAHIDGENIAELATTTITMDYTQESEKLLNSNDANKPGILPTFQKYKDQ